MDESTQSGVPVRRHDLAAFVGGVMERFDDDPVASLARLAEAGRQLERFREDEDYEAARSFVGASTNLFRALVLVQSEADFANAALLLDQARAGFSALELEELADAAEGLRLYFAGIVEIRQQNLGRAVELLKKAPEYLRKGGDFGARYRPLIDHMAPDQLFVAGAVAVSQQDFPLAKVLLEDAAQKAEYVASTYYDESSPDHLFFQGLGKLLRAYFDTFKLSSDFSRFDLDRAVQAHDAAQGAREAGELIARAGLDNPIRRNCHRLAGILGGIVDVLAPAARLLRALLEGKPTPDTDYAALGRRIQEIENVAAAAGEQGVVFVRVCAQLNATLDNLRRYDLARPKPAAARKAAGPTRLFVMMPFSDESRVVEEALLEVFENEPYSFDVILARDRTLRSSLFENVKAHMELVDGFLADISELNPNVMLELGMTENDPRQRPVFVLRREGSKEPPSDLKGRLYVEYALPPADEKDRVERLAQELRQKFDSIEDIEQLRLRRQARYLSAYYIRGQIKRARLTMDDKEIERLQKAFETVEELEAADAGQIARKTGFDASLVAGVVRAFKPKAKKTAR